MSQLESLIALLSIIVGLGITDLAQSVRELVRPSRAVDWHYLPVLWAGNVVLILLQFWWVSFNALREPLFGQPLVFLPYRLTFVGLFACAFALPDLDRNQNERGGPPLHRAGGSRLTWRNFTSRPNTGSGSSGP